jgi:hypothetical protein
VLEAGELSTRLVTLQAHLTNLYKKAVIKGGRRTFANRVLEKTGDMETVAQLLGHVHGLHPKIFGCESSHLERDVRNREVVA